MSTDTVRREAMLCVVAASGETTDTRRRASVQRQWAAKTCAFIASLHDTFHADSHIIQGMTDVMTGRPPTSKLTGSDQLAVPSGAPTCVVIMPQVKVTGVECRAHLPSTNSTIHLIVWEHIEPPKPY